MHNKKHLLVMICGILCILLAVNILCICYLYPKTQYDPCQITSEQLLKSYGFTQILVGEKFCHTTLDAAGYFKIPENMPYNLPGVELGLSEKIYLPYFVDDAYADLPVDVYTYAVENPYSPHIGLMVRFSFLDGKISETSLSVDEDFADVIAERGNDQEYTVIWPLYIPKEQLRSALLELESMFY